MALSEGAGLDEVTLPPPALGASNVVEEGFRTRVSVALVGGFVLAENELLVSLSVELRIGGTEVGEKVDISSAGRAAAEPAAGSAGWSPDPDGVWLDWVFTGVSGERIEGLSKTAGTEKESARNGSNPLFVIVRAASQSGKALAAGFALESSASPPDPGFGAASEDSAVGNTGLTWLAMLGVEDGLVSIDLATGNDLPEAVSGTTVEPGNERSFEPIANDCRIGAMWFGCGKI